jgi:hypothetical protein
VRYLSLALALALIGGCASPSRYQEKDTPVVSQGKEDLYKHFDSEVKISGKAATDPKGGVMVVLDDGTRVFIPEMKSWPGKIDGHRVSVTGVLHRIPAPPGPGDQLSKGEDRFVLNAVRWQAGTPPKTTTQPTVK